jgi:putative sigma-54 modulation protein
MNLTITGHHLEVTPAIRGYVEEKLKRVTRHFDNVIDVGVILTVEKLKHKAEVNLHVAGKDIYVEAIEADMYASVDVLVDKLDRQVLKHKEKAGGHHREVGSMKRQTVEE